MRARAFIGLVVVTVIVSGASASNNTHEPKGSGKAITYATPDPKTAREHNNRGVELRQHEMWAEAVKEHHLALMEEPGNKAFRTNLSAVHLEYGKKLAKKGDFMAATVQFHWAIFVDPDNKEAAEELKSLEKNAAGSNHSTWPSRSELDQFLKGKASSLRGYDAITPLPEK
jgi:hypothetical protein